MMEDDYLPPMLNSRYVYDMQLRKYQDDLAQELARKMQLQLEQSFLGSYKSEFKFGDPQQTVIEITDRAPKAVLDYLEFSPELVMRVVNVADITQLSHDIRRAVAHDVHLKYERQQNYLDIYFERAQDFVLVKMFAE